MNDRPEELARLARQVESIRLTSESKATLLDGIESRMQHRSFAVRGTVVLGVIMLTLSAAAAIDRRHDQDRTPDADPAVKKVVQKATKRVSAVTPGSEPPPMKKSTRPPVARHAPSPKDEPASRRSRVKREQRRSAAWGGSDLARQVAAYNEILALAGKDDHAAVVRWRRFVQRWPEGTLRHEAEVQQIAALLRLRRVEEARAAATGFVERYPHSIKVGEMKTLLDRVDAGSKKSDRSQRPPPLER